MEVANSDPTNNAVPQNRKIEELPEKVNPKIGYNSGKRWSDDENNVLKSLLDAKSWEDINWKYIRDEEKLFGRDLNAIQDKARKFFKKERQDRKIGYNIGKPWSEDENNVLKSLLDSKSLKDINWKDIRNEEKLFGRDLNAIQDKARKFFKKERHDPKIGCNIGKLWSDDENNVLKSLLDAKSWKDINWKDIRDEEKLFGRDLNAIQDKARNFLKKERREKEFTESQVKRKGKKVKKVAENSELPWDVLDIISKTLDFDDLFRFAGVCKNWRAFYWRNLLALQEPLLLQVLYNHTESYSFISLPNQKIYCLKMMKHFLRSIYVTSSSGYFIMAGYNNSFILINPFTRIKKVINVSTFEVKSNIFAYHALLAFDKCSEEFVLVVLCKSSRSLRVYQSQNCGWVTYSTMGNLGRVVDFMVLHNIIYVVTDKANIGVLSLNSAAIKFLKLKNVPNVTTFQFLRLVNCDEQLLVVDLSLKEIRNVYKIDFSTMNYVKLETLGDISLFYAANRNCYALSNPNRWGYESNSVCHQSSVYTM